MAKKSEDERQTEILDAAVAYFAERGYSAATTRDIAAAAGVAEGTIFRYFPTKKSMLHAITLRFLSGAADAAMRPIEEMLRNAESRDIRSIFYDILMDRLALMERLYPMARVALTEMLYHEDIRELIQEKLLNRAFEAFRQFHQAMEARGMIRRGLSSEALFRSMFANVLLFVVQHKLFPSDNPTEMETAFDQMFDVIYGGLAPREGEQIQ